MDEDVDLSGPLLDGTAERAAARAMVAIRHVVAEEGKMLAARRLNASIRHHGTGKAVSSITKTDWSVVYETDGSGKTYTMPIMALPGETIVTSDLATYGPWLEGTGSRNETTRFKGYHSFRLASRELEGVATDLANAALRPFLEEMQ